MTSSDDLEAQIKEMFEQKYQHSKTDYGPHSQSYWPLAEDIFKLVKAHLDRDRKMKAELASKLTAIERGNPGMKYFALLRSEIAKLEADSKTEASE